MDFLFCSYCRSHYTTSVLHLSYATSHLVEYESTWVHKLKKRREEAHFLSVEAKFQWLGIEVSRNILNVNTKTTLVLRNKERSNFNALYTENI